MALKPSGQTTRDVAIALLVIATLGLILRIISKIRSRQKWGAEDALIILALLLLYGFNAVLLHGMYKAGGTMEFSEMTLDGLVLTAKSVYINEMFMTAILTSVKFSVLLWYRRIFFVDDSFRRRCNIVMLLCAIWAIVVLFVLIFQCAPIKAAWDPIAKATGKCTNIGSIILGYEISNILLDIAILAMPIARIRRIQASKATRLAIAGLFSLGGLIIIACILRVNFLYNKNSLLADDFRGMLWSNIELSVAVLCGCLPALRSLFPRDLKISQRFRSLYASLPVARQSTYHSERLSDDVTESSRNLRMEPTTVKPVV